MGKLRIDPAKNPAVWDTLTWDSHSFARTVSSQPRDLWDTVCASVGSGRPAPALPGVKVHDHSAGHLGKSTIALVECTDGQHGLVEFAKSHKGEIATEPVANIALSDGTTARFHQADSKSLHQVYSKAAPSKLPQALKMVPRLGIGTRMSKAVWPGIWQALQQCSFSANGIQNSLRELNLLENIREGRASEKLYYPGIGFVPEGHTGSTFEGLWLCGVSEALKAGGQYRYGADADHIMVKRGADGLERAKKVLLAARYYTFFTIDVSDILDYSSLDGSVAAGLEEVLNRCIGDEKTRRDVRAHYRGGLRFGGRSITLNETELAGLIGKYWLALEALDHLVPFISEMRHNEPFDLELSIDEHPPEIHPFDCLTTEMEVAFLLEESRRRSLPLTHLAPNLGVEKHVDYRYRDGLEGLEARTRGLHRLVQEQGVLLDCHSGDDLSEATRGALKRATGGMIHFKVSPYLQTLFADVLYDFDRQMFKTWWDDTYEFARENAREGSAHAADCLKEYEGEPGASPHPKFNLFRLYCYATVGKRDEVGNFIYREKFYSLSPDFYTEYTRRVNNYLCTLARDLLP
jgi:hypothetical protein